MCIELEIPYNLETPELVRDHDWASDYIAKI